MALTCADAFAAAAPVGSGEDIVARASGTSPTVLAANRSGGVAYGGTPGAVRRTSVAEAAACEAAIAL